MSDRKLPPLIHDHFGEGKHLLKYDSFAHLVELASQDIGERPCNESRYGFNNDETDNCYDSFDEAIEMAATGDHELTAELLQMAEYMPSTITHTRRRKPIPAFCGHAPIVGAAVANYPLSMLRFVRTGQGRPVVKIGFNPGIHGCVNGNVYKYKGAALLLLIDRLEAAGYAVDVDLVHTRSRSLSSLVPLKSTAHYTDPAVIAAAVAKAIVNRRLFFSMIEIDPRPESTCYHSGYGSSQDYHGAAEYDLYMKVSSGDDPDFATAKSAAQWAQRWLDSLTAKKED